MFQLHFVFYRLFFLFCLTTAVSDYWSENFDEDKNCLREEEMKKLEGLEAPRKCATGAGGGRLVAVFYTLIGRGPSRLGSHWSRISYCCLHQLSCAIKNQLRPFKDPDEGYFLPLVGSLWHKDRSLLLYRSTCVIKNWISDLS